MTDSVTRDYRSKLLTRRVRAIIRAFNKNPKYLGDEKPNITWDELFIPPELYVNLKRELESIDAKESQQMQKRKENEKEKEKMQEKEKGKELEKKEREKKARESQRQKMEEQIAKEKARVAQSDKKKAKNTSQEKKNPNKTESSIPKWTVKTSGCIYIPSDDETDNPVGVAKPPDSDDAEEIDNTEKTPKRKWTRKTSESSASYDTSADEAQAEPPAKRAKFEKSIDDIPPCQRCTQLKKDCITNGFPAACESCRKAKSACNLSRGRNLRSEKPQTTTPLRNKKSIAELELSLYRSSTEDEEDVNQLDIDIPNIVTIVSAKTPKSQSKIKSKPPPKAEGSSSRNFDYEHVQQQLKVSQEELRIAQQQLQLANSRIEAQQELYESQRNLYEAQLASYRRPQMRGQGSGGKAKERA